MKKAAHLLILTLSLVLISTSCGKDDDPNPEQTTSIYGGSWNTNATYKNNALIANDANYSVFVLNNNSTANCGNRQYPSWSVTGSTLTLNAGDYQKETLNIVIKPTTTAPNLMTLEWVISGNTYKFELSK